jgi:hypothetical protein
MSGSAEPAAAATDVRLPGSLRAAVRAEFGRALRPPYETPSVVVVNGALMTACWGLLPTDLVDAVFTFHGPVAFAMVLASWMYSDVPATNLLGADAARTVAALPDPAVLRRLWYAKNIVLWMMITPLCAIVAIGIGIYEGQLTTTALSIIWIAVVPLGALGFSAWLGIRYPYHPLPLRRRWAARRRRWPMIGRWLVLVLTPYGLVPLLTAVLTLPSVLLWAAVAPGGQATHITNAQFAWGLVLAGALALVAWPLGHRYGTRRAHRRRQRLAAFLADPDRG